MAKHSYTEHECQQLLAEVMDKERILLHCEPHKYIGSSMPPSSVGCKNCWKAYWWYMIASTPPHLREIRLEQAYRAVYDAVKSHERGEFDFEPLARPVIEYDKDGYDEVLQIERIKDKLEN